jgi:serine protease Do
VDELARAISQMRGETLQLEGMYPGYDGIYRYPLNLED